MSDATSFLNNAESWLDRMHDALARGDATDFASCLDELERIESDAQALISRLRGLGVHEAPQQKYALIQIIHQLGRKALVCSALSENQALYARVGQSLALPAREYDHGGSLVSVGRQRSHWEA